MNTASTGTFDPGTEFSGLQDWFGGALGTQLLNTESAILEQLLSGLFGYHLLQLSITDRDLYGGSPVGHKVRMGCVADSDTPFIGDYRELPFANDSLDVVLVQHVLDVCDSPKQVLREANRVTLPSGWLVIVGFNPWSSWGLWKMLKFWGRKAPFSGEYLRPGRLMDWLTLLDFSIDRAIYGYHGLPTARATRFRTPDFSQGLSRKLNWPFGAFYVIVARKQTPGMTPLRPVWGKQQTALGNIAAVKTVGRHAATRQCGVD